MFSWQSDYLSRDTNNIFLEAVKIITGLKYDRIFPKSINYEDRFDRLCKGPGTLDLGICKALFGDDIKSNRHTEKFRYAAITCRQKLKL